MSAACAGTRIQANARRLSSWAACSASQQLSFGAIMGADAGGRGDVGVDDGGVGDGAAGAFSEYSMTSDGIEEADNGCNVNADCAEATGNEYDIHLDTPDSSGAGAGAHDGAGANAGGEYALRQAPDATGDRRTAQNEYMDLANNENLMAPMC